jgi:hypothetical protein
VIKDLYEYLPEVASIGTTNERQKVKGAKAGAFDYATENLLPQPVLDVRL